MVISYGKKTKGAYLESPSYYKNPPVGAVQLVLSGKAENQISGESDTIEISLKNAMARDIKLFMPVSQGSSKLKQYFVHPHLAAIRMRVRVGAKLYLRRSNHDR